MSRFLLLLIAVLALAVPAIATADKGGPKGDPGPPAPGPGAVVVADPVAPPVKTISPSFACDPDLGCTGSTYQCSNQIDDDGDGLVDMNDPGCTGSSDNDEYNAPTGGGTPPPPPPPTPDSITYGTAYLTGDWDYGSDYRVLTSNSGTITCPAPNHYKIRTYRAQWATRFINTNALSFTAQYAVCYVPGGAIKFTQVWPAYNPSAQFPWTWITPNDNGFPTQQPYVNQGIFRWQGSAQIWPGSVTPTKHPGLQITFYPSNGTESKYVWAG